ncbi:MAG TPA: xanthine dehydrogenase molybdopterin binding subunit [Thermoanaerobaculia bacterium]|nr:xanthine dehydrogenase molybdopterin binding subunit [Thermoanaerobaculia bacterium]
MGVVGRNIPHDSAEGHVTGESIYIDDIPPLRNELFVDFFWARTSHARILSLELTAASRVPGIVAVFTAADLTTNCFGPIIHDEPLMATDVITFMGQPIVVLAGETRDSVKRAKLAVAIQLEPLTPIFTIDEALSQNEIIGQTRVISRGNLADGFEQADHLLEGVFISGGQDHFYLESQAAIVYPGEGDTLTVHSSTQNPSEVQHVIAQLLGLRLNQVVCITRRMGGGFGGKECQATHPAAMAALVAHKTKRPARIAYNKDDDMQVTGKRHPFQNRYEVGFTKEGAITALQVELVSDGGAYADLSPAVMGRAMTHVDNAYYLPNVHITGKVCRTNTPPNTAFRGFGGPQGVATIENILEEIAMRLGRDPVDIRMLNCYGISERNVTPYGQVVSNNNLPLLFEELVSRSDYRARRDDVLVFNGRTETQLKGISMTGVKFGISFNTKFLNQANALVNIYLDGSVQVSTGATEMGQGVNTKIRQLVADELGISTDDVTVMITSTEKNNNTSATAASSAADLNGSAAVDACRKLRERLAECARDYFAASPAGSGNIADSVVRSAMIRFEEGFVFAEESPDTRISFAQLVHYSYVQQVSLGERGFFATPGLAWDAEKGVGNPFLYFTQGCAVSEVLIDRFTGEVTVLRADVLMDIGRPINPGIDRGQMTGAFVQGMGWVTTEDLRYADTGELLSHSPTTYKIPNIQDLPMDFNVDYIEIENSVNIRGSKATGEPPLLMAISVWTAIKHALSFASNGEIPKPVIPATHEEIVMLLAGYENARVTELTAGVDSERLKADNSRPS